MGQDIQGPVRQVQVHAGLRGQEPERLRLPGTLGRGRGREGTGIQIQAGHRGLRPSRFRHQVQTESTRLLGQADRAEHTPRHVDRLEQPGRAQEAVHRAEAAHGGDNLLHVQRREQLHDMEDAQELPRPGMGLPGRRHHAMVPQVQHRHQPARDSHRGLPGGNPHQRLRPIQAQGNPGPSQATSPRRSTPS